VFLAYQIVKNPIKQYSKNMKTIHFVCNGNLYRSRTAEAIWKRDYAHLASASSSGIKRDVSRPKYGAFTWPAAYIQYNYELTPYFAQDSRQTTLELLQDQDLIVIMYPTIAEVFAERYPGFDNTTVLEIPDLNDSPDFSTKRTSDQQTLWIAHHADNTYRSIQEQLQAIVDTFAN
jgi:protein-tyrosine-phosphatase